MLTKITISLIMEWAALFWLIVSVAAAAASANPLARMYRNGDSDAFWLAVSICLGWMIHAMLAGLWFTVHFFGGKWIFEAHGILVIIALGTFGSILHVRTFTKYKLGNVGWMLLVAVAGSFSTGAVAAGLYAGVLP